MTNRQHHRRSGAMLLLFMAFPACLCAQLIRGNVSSRDLQRPIDSAQVLAVNLGNAAEYPQTYTNERGEFTLEVSDAGQLAVWVRKIGYRPHLAVLSVQADDTLSVDVVLEGFVVEVEGVTVYGIAAVTDGQREFWSRRNLAWNTSVDYTEIERLHQDTVSDVVQVLPLTVRRCRPIVYVDGFRRSRMNDIPLDWVYGIEVYQGYFNIPNRYRDPHDGRAQCGAVLLWTKARR